MFLLKGFALITTLLHLTTSTSAHSYTVDGCFSSLPGTTVDRDLGRYNSNNKCQTTCKKLGYIMAGTKGNLCKCGNIYPEGNNVRDTECSTPCRSWSSCYGPKSCCGGPNAYSVSIVGDIDIAKQILRRLAKKWQEKSDYRRDMKDLVNEPSRGNHYDNWWDSFNSAGWSTCSRGRYMFGMYRNKRSSSDPISRIEEIDCYDAPGYLYSSSNDRDCYDHNWWDTFDRKGWAECNNGYYMAGLYRTSGNGLSHIEEAFCCRPKTQAKQWGNCIIKDVWDSFNNKGWSDCPSGYYMAGLYRNSCNKLYCLEQYWCCQMGPYNGDSWLERPELVIRVTNESGALKKCSIKAMDMSRTSDTFKCESFSGDSKMLKLNAKKFSLEDKTPLSVLKPQPIPNFRPVVCSAFTKPYTCAKQLSTKISKSSTLTTSVGSSLAVAVGASVEVSRGGGLFLPDVKAAFSREVTKTTSFTVENSNTKTYETTDATDVSIQVPANKEIKINLLRTFQNLKYKWEAEFELAGWYSIKWSNGQEVPQAVNTLLSGPKERIRAFGTWSYPGTDLIRVVITDKYGNEQKSGCEHKTGKGETCKFNVEG